MAPYEYRICAEPDPEEELSWVVRLFIRPVSPVDAPSSWRCVLTIDARSQWQGDRPAAYWKDILKACRI